MLERLHHVPFGHARLHGSKHAVVGSPGYLAGFPDHGLFGLALDRSHHGQDRGAVFDLDVQVTVRDVAEHSKIRRHLLAEECEGVQTAELPRPGETTVEFSSEARESVDLRDPVSLSKRRADLLAEAVPLLYFRIKRLQEEHRLSSAGRGGIKQEHRAGLVGDAGEILEMRIRPIGAVQRRIRITGEDQADSILQRLRHLLASLRKLGDGNGGRLERDGSWWHRLFLW